MPIGNRSPEASLLGEFGGMLSRMKRFGILGPRKLRFFDSEHKFPIISAQNVTCIYKRELQISPPEEVATMDLKNG